MAGVNSAADPMANLLGNEIIAPRIAMLMDQVWQTAVHEDMATRLRLDGTLMTLIAELLQADDTQV
ncbi:MAG: hypothetical protein AAFQ42_02800 [Pseudomonadota bacterium]